MPDIKPIKYNSTILTKQVTGLFSNDVDIPSHAYLLFTPFGSDREQKSFLWSVADIIIDLLLHLIKPMHILYLTGEAIVETTILKDTKSPLYLKIPLALLQFALLGAICFALATLICAVALPCRTCTTVIQAGLSMF